MSRIWSVYTAAPHRVLFLPGAVQSVIAIAWWLLDIEIRQAGGAGLAIAGLPSPLLHGWLMVFGLFPFFVFGFLFTALPNWVSGPPISKAAYVASMFGLSIGTILLYLGESSLGLLAHLLGWSVAMRALLSSLRAGRDADKRHARATWVALLIGAVAEAVMLAGLVFDYWEWLQPALELGIWGFLVPLFLSVCHRMIPFFTSRVAGAEPAPIKPGGLLPMEAGSIRAPAETRQQPGYVMIRPYPLLWAMWAACLIHVGLFVNAWGYLTWLVDFPMAALVFWFSSRWGLLLSFKVRLLAMLHVAFLWAGAAFALFGLDSLAGFLGLAWSAGNAPLHALGIGFFGAMLIGMASRVSLGHSGRALQADAATWWLFWLIQGVALLRMLPDLSAGALPARLASVAGLAWLLVFGVWAWKYAPMTWRPRVDGKAG